MTKVCDTLDTELHGFTPFNDAYQMQAVEVMTSVYDNTTDGMDTTAEDPFRQGVEILTNRQRFVGMLPKIWSGNICGFTKINTLGQFENFVEYSGVRSFNDTQIKFDPIAFINDSVNYPYPLIFNDGPQEKFEVGLEPLTILFRKNTNEIIAQTAHSVKGYFETDGYLAIQFEQYYYPQTEDHLTFFLDLGDRYVGDSSNLDEKLAIPGYVNIQEAVIKPFDDSAVNNANNPLIKQLRTTNPTLINLLMSSSMDLNLNNDIRDEFNTRSKSAGYDVYGPTSKIYGTDSIAYIGLTRGA